MYFSLLWLEVKGQEVEVKMRNSFEHIPVHIQPQWQLYINNVSTESMFWTVRGSLIKGKPRSLGHFGFPAWVQDVDAAVHVVKTGRTLFFMHDIYWR